MTGEAKDSQGYLKCCPFCGGRDLKYHSVRRTRTEYEGFIQCLTCTSLGPNGADRESATLQWNRRFDDDDAADDDDASARAQAG